MSKLLSMSEASKISPYEKGYLSLLARRGELQAQKMGRNWYTTVEWLNEYLRNKKPSQIIDAEKIAEKKLPWRKFLQRFFWAFAIVFVLALAFGVYFYRATTGKIREMEKKTDQFNFTPEEIIKIPNEEGNYNVYGTGTMKMGEEKISNLPEAN
jgi:hypothetical protein